MKTQFFEFGQIVEKKEVQKFVNGHGNENKRKENTPTCQGVLYLSKHTNRHWIVKTHI
jgi:hypothetical protein